jgi:hypothetical protein
MNQADDSASWVVVVASRARDGNRITDNPRQNFVDWLRANGIGPDAFTDDEVRIDTNRVRLPEGGAGCNMTYSVRVDALRRLGIGTPSIPRTA